MAVKHVYHIPRTLIERSERTGIPVETLISMIALRFGSVTYRDDIKRALGMSDEQYRELMSPSSDGPMRRRDDSRLRLALPRPVQWALFAMVHKRGRRFYTPRRLYESIANVLDKYADRVETAAVQMAYEPAHATDIGDRHLYLVPKTLIEVSQRSGCPVELVISLIALRYGPAKYHDDICRALDISDKQPWELMSPRATPSAQHLTEKPLRMKLTLVQPVRESLYAAGYARHPFTRISRLALYDSMAEFLAEHVTQLKTMAT
jgi:hypothetical protein